MKYIIPFFMLACIFALPAHAGETKRDIQARTFHGYACTQDCSGHKAGFAWAQKKGITDPNTCSGHSNSFIEGCRAWAISTQNRPTPDPRPAWSPK